MSTMDDAGTPDAKHAIAERNRVAILEAAEHLIRTGRPVSISAVGLEAGVSRVTVYSHFRDRRELLEAVVTRTVERVMAAIEPAELDRGPAVDALQRLVDAAWEQLARNSEIRRASAAELDEDAMRRAHGPAHTFIVSLVNRGRSDGSFRTDVPAGWLISSLLALVHAAADDVNAGALDENGARAALRATVTDLFVGSGRSPDSQVGEAPTQR